MKLDIVHRFKFNREEQKEYSLDPFILDPFLFGGYSYISFWSLDFMVM